MKVTLRNDAGGEKVVKDGFSWTTLFFGLFVPIIRGDLKYCLIMLLADLVTFGIAWLVWPFIYNKRYISDLQEKGYKIVE